MSGQKIIRGLKEALEHAKSDGPPSGAPDAAGIVEELRGSNGGAWRFDAATALKSLSQSLASKDAEIERLREKCECLQSLYDKIYDMQAANYRRAEAAEARIAELEKALAEAREDLERIAAANVLDFDTLHPDACQQVAREALARLARQGAKP